MEQMKYEGEKSLSRGRYEARRVNHMMWYQTCCSGIWAYY